MEEIQILSSISNVESCVSELLSRDDSGHDMDHINRVLHLSLKFAEGEDADKELVALVALLHDVDDYKLFGENHAQHFTNTRKIMHVCNIDEGIQRKVEQSIREIGYDKRLGQKAPVTLTGKIVSDADMCDSMGAVGIIRTHTFGIKHNRPFFNRNVFPRDNLDAAAYKNQSTSTSVCHYFEKILNLKSLMLTEPGRREAEKRHHFAVEFLKHFFEEENAPEWLELLRKYET